MRIGFLPLNRYMLFEQEWLFENPIAFEIFVIALCNARFKDDGKLKAGQWDTSYSYISCIMRSDGSTTSRRTIKKWVDALAEHNFFTVSTLQNAGIRLTIQNYSTWTSMRDVPTTKTHTENKQADKKSQEQPEIESDISEDYWE